MKLRTLILVPLASWLLSACDDTSPDSAATDTCCDTTPGPDVALEDTAQPDAPPDGVTQPDTATEDTTSADTSLADTSTEATSAGDTFAEDTSSADTHFGDTHIADNDTSTTDTSITDTSVPDNTGPTCDREGVPALNSYTRATTDGVDHEIVACDPEGPDRICLRLLLTRPVPTSRIDLAEGDPLACTQCVVLYEGCDGPQCEAVYIADAGELELGRIEGPGGRIEFTLTDAHFVELQANAVTNEPELRPGGRTWCHVSLEQSITYELPEQRYTTAEQTTLTPMIGNRTEDDERRDVRCQPGYVASGLSATWYEYEDFPVDVIDSFSLFCANPRVAPFGSERSSIYEYLGFEDEFSLRTDSWCAPGQLLVGAAATFLEGIEEDPLRGLAARCADIHAWVDTTAPAPTIVTGPWSGASATNPATFACPRGSALVGLRTDAEILSFISGHYVRFHTLRGLCQPLVSLP